MQLFGEVQDVLHLCRDSTHSYGPHLNRMRRARRYKYSPRERLFIFLCYCRQYGSNSFRRMANTWSWSHATVFQDFMWLRENLVAHEAMVSAVTWGTPQERETQRLQLQRAGVCASIPSPTHAVGLHARFHTCDGIISGSFMRRCAARWPRRRRLHLRRNERLRQAL